MIELSKGLTKTVYTHKNGDMYVLISVIKYFIMGGNSTKYALYANMAGKLFLREEKEFFDGRFTESDKVSTAYHIDNVGAFKLNGYAARIFGWTALKYSRGDIIDDTNKNDGRVMSLVWEGMDDNAIVYALSTDDLIKLRKESDGIPVVCAQEDNTEKAVKGHACEDHIIGVHFLPSAVETIVPLLAIGHECTPSTFINEKCTIYKYCPNCGKKIDLRSVSVRRKENWFITTLWDENIVEA
mgnify:CR=1 FL=1